MLLATMLIRKLVDAFIEVDLAGDASHPAALPVADGGYQLAAENELSVP